MRRCSSLLTLHARLAGLTVVELVVAVAILALLATAVLPSMAGALDRRQLASTSADAASLLQAARSAALARGEPLRVTLHTHAAGTCLLLHAGAAAACGCDIDAAGQPLPRCADSGSLVLARTLPAATGIALALPPSGLRHDPATGTTTPTATLRVSGRAGAVHHTVNLTGRVRSCATVAGLGGHPPC